MGILDRIRKKGEEQEAEKEGKEEDFRAHQVLPAPMITEKTTRLAKEENQYTFKVRKSVSKGEIEKAIEEVYGVEVEKVRTLKIPKKRRRLGRTTGWKRGFKKAIVSVREDQRIEFMSA